MRCFMILVPEAAAEEGAAGAAGAAAKAEPVRALIAAIEAGGD